MFSRWLVVVVVVLTASANPDRAAVARETVTVGPTSEVKGHAEAELTISCGDGKSSGLVQYWHTPFGDLKRPGFVEPGPVLMRSDGTLVVSNCSRRHSGLYYCLLQDARGTTLWPYQLHVHPDHGGLQEVRVASRSSRVIGSDDGVSQQDLAVAVAATVLLTFVVGFSAGALSRTYVLRCLGAIRTRIQSPRQHSDQTDHSGVTMTTLPPWDGHREAEPVDCDETMETTVSSITSSPPIKPQRSFRHKGDEEEEEPRVYLEGCGHGKEEEEGLEEEDQEEETYGGLYVSGGDEEEENEGDEEEEEGRRREEKESQRRRQVEEKGDEEEEEVEERRREEEETQRRQEEKGGDEEKERREEKEKGDEEEKKEERREEKETQRRQEEKEGDEEEKEEERGEETQRRRQEEEVQRPHSEASSEGGDPKPEASSETRRCRVIRLYQYDEEGQRYCHLPDPAPNEPGPAPRPRQRSVSLTRLNAIMAAASAGPLDSDGDAGRREEAHFHMDI